MSLKKNIHILSMNPSDGFINKVVWRDERRRGGKRLMQLLLAYTRITSLILVYYVFSIGLTFYQKDLFSTFKFPLIVVIVHLVVKFAMAATFRYFWTHWSNVHRTSVGWYHFCLRVLPAGAAAGLDIGLSQWSLEYITVTLYTMSKSTALLFILIFAIVFKLEEMRWSIVVLVVLIAGGLCMFTYKYTQFHLFGFILVMSASLLSGLRWTLSQLLMQKAELGLTHPIDLVYHIQPWMALCLLPIAIPFEGVEIAGSDLGFNYSDLSVAGYVWLKVLFGAFIAFCMEISEYYLVSCTSSLTFSISGVAKEIATLSIAVVFHNEHLSLINKLGLVCCVVGISLHVVIKTLSDSSKDSSTKVQTVYRLGDGAQPLLSDTESEEIEMFTR